MPLGTFSSSPTLPLEENFLVSSLNGTQRQCSQHTCHENFLTHSKRGYGSVGRPSVPWHLASLLMVWFWTWTDLMLSSSQLNLRRLRGRRARELE